MRTSILLLFFVQCYSSLFSAHILGGDITYACLGINTDNTIDIEVTCRVFRDNFSSGALCDFQFDFGLYEEQADGDWHFVSIVGNETVPDVVALAGMELDSCLDSSLPAGECLELCEYVFEIENLPIIDFNYQIAYQRCCLANTIQNVMAPEDTGIALNSIITSQAQNTCNSSPIITKEPIKLFCAGGSIEYDMSAIDADGDSLVYTLCAPLEAGGPEGASIPGDPGSCNGIMPTPALCVPPFDPVVFASPFSSDFPIPSDPAISIGATTGIISGVINAIGQYMLAVCIDEYRDGVWIGSVRRQMAITSIACEGLQEVTLSSNAEGGDPIYQIEVNQEFTITNDSGDAFAGHIWALDLGSNTITEFTNSFSWTFEEAGIYQLVLTVSAGTSCEQVILIDIEVLDDKVNDIFDVFVPNAFSPNGDGKNDAFGVVALNQDFEEFSLQIWNRWGELIFETDNPGILWEGNTKGGTKHQQGVYVYTLNYKYPNRSSEEKRGNISLLK